MGARNVIGIYGMGLTQHVEGWANLGMLVTLLLLRGNIGRPGAGGAAGGLAAMIGAHLVDGGAVVARAVGLADALADADLCLTGEGRLDGQTRAGKAPAVVAAACAQAGVPCVGLFGGVDLSPVEARAMGFAQVRPIASASRPHAAALAATAEDLESCNAAIAGGAVETVGGTRVEEPLEAALVREDGTLLYPIRDGIPVLLADEGIATA